jgi:hypothetical protein
VPAGPHADEDAEKALTRLLAQRDVQRNARTRATVNQLLDKYFDLTSVQETTKENYEMLARRHIRPLLGTVQLAKINGETLDSFTRCSASAVRAARGGSTSSTAPRGLMSATRSASPTSATASQTVRCGRSTPCCPVAGKREPVRASRPASVGSIEARSLLRRTKPRRSPRRPGRTSIGACSYGWPW